MLPRATCTSWLGWLCYTCHAYSANTLSTPRIKKDGACTGTWELQELNQIEDMEAIRKADGHMKM